jgi:hypothetical protein
VCCLLVLDTVTSTPQWIRQPKPRGCVFVFVCKYVLGRSRATQPPNLRLCLLRHFGFLTSPHAIPTRSGCHPNSFRLLRRSTSVPHPIPRAHFLHLPTSPRLSLFATGACHRSPGLSPFHLPNHVTCAHQLPFSIYMCVLRPVCVYACVNMCMRV